MTAAARLDDPIQHSNALMGLLTGALVGAAAGLFIVATGGLGAGLVAAAIVGGAAATGAGIGGVLGSLSCAGGTVTGGIERGSRNTAINSLAAARATVDWVHCSGTPPGFLCPSHRGKRIAQGSKTVSVNGQPAARVGDKIECGSKIHSGSPNVIIGGPTQQTLEIDDEIPGYITWTVFVVGVASAVILAGPIAAVCGTLGSVVGGSGAQWFAAQLGADEDLQKLMGLGGSLLGGMGGGKFGSWAGAKAPIANLEQSVMDPLLKNSGYRSDIAAMKGASPTQLEARSQIANDFYAQHGTTWDADLQDYRPMTPNEIDSHVGGIDLTKPVEIVEAPDRLGSWQPPKGYQGDYYFADPKCTPNDLGVGDYARNSDGVAFREQTSYAIEPGTEAIRSTSAAVIDDHSVPGIDQSTSGGGVQYYMPNKAAATPIEDSGMPLQPDQVNPDLPAIPDAPPAPPASAGAPPMTSNSAVPSPGPGSGWEEPFNPLDAGHLGSGAAAGAGIGSNSSTEDQDQ